jgi:cytochrome c oxidase cbb3-type subunit III
LGGRGPGAQPAATVTLASGQQVSGTIRRLDDFDVSLVDASGAFHSWPREAVRVEVPDPVKGHRALLARYTDADVHNVTAYLATLK